jgi:hypothetical protein
VKVVSGEPYEDYVEQHIFAPLGMTHSYAYLAEAGQHGIATGHQFWFGHPRSGGGLENNRAITPTGLLSSTAEDMSRYLIAHLNGGTLASSRILAPGSVAELHRGVGDMGHDAKYAMGWIDGDLDDVPILTHNGDTGDFHATLIMEPRAKWGVVVLMNGANDLDAGQDRVAYGVMARLLGVKAPHDPGIVANIPLLIVLGFATIIVLQIAGAVRSAILIRRWRRDARLRARGVKAVLLHLVGPWIVSVVWAGFALLILPPALSLPASLVLRVDIGWPIVISGALALLWGVLAKPALAILTLRSRPPAPIDLPPTHVRVGAPA